MLFIDYLVLGTSGLAAVTDLKTRKIPNWLTLGAAAAGMAGGIYFLGPPGILFSVQGWLFGISIFLIPFILGGMGGGDVKLMGAVGALAGASFVFKAALCGALWGGVIALVVILVKKKTVILRRFATGIKLYILTNRQAGKELLAPREYEEGEEKLYIPYGAAIFLGVVTAYLLDLKILS